MPIRYTLNKSSKLVGWLVVLMIYVALAVFRPYRDLEAGDNQYLKFKWRGGESNPRTSCFATQELNHSATVVPPKSSR